MKPADRRLLREIIIVAALKLLLLALLWQVFVRDDRVELDDAQIAQRLHFGARTAAPAGATKPDSPSAEPAHDQ